MADYQTLHPATKLWWAQRKTCERCRHLHDARPGGGMRCLASEWPAPYCIDARGAGKPCGPDANLFKERS